MASTIKRDTIQAGGINIGVYTTDFENEFISLTDIARYRSSDPRITIHTWLRGRDVVEFLGLWESLHNPGFKRSEFDAFRADAGSNAFVFSIKDWTNKLSFPSQGRDHVCHILLALQAEPLCLSSEVFLRLAQCFHRGVHHHDPSSVLHE